MSRKIRLIVALALLLMGSARLRAGTDDPFPAVNPHDFYGSMMLPVKVVAGGQVLTQDVIVAVYVGDEIRGKGSPTDTEHPGVAYLTVYGNQCGDELTFKVAANGVVVECKPGLAYTFNGNDCSPLAPYVLDITDDVPYSGFTMKTIDGRRTAMFDVTSEETVSIPLPLQVDDVQMNYSFKPGRAAAIILPFDIANVVKLTNCKLYRFDKVEYEAPKWVVTVRQVPNLEANNPYLILPNEENLVFDFGGKPVTMMTAPQTPASKNGWTFRGTYETIRWTAQSTDYGISARNAGVDSVRKLTRFADGDYILPFHCYVSYVGEHAPGSARAMAGVSTGTNADTNVVLPNEIEIRFIDDIDTGISTLTPDSFRNGKESSDSIAPSDVWMSLDGRRLSGKPATPGLYIHSGRKVIVP